MHNFIHVPKTAGCSIRQISYTNRQIGYCEHTRITDVPSFSIIRHPYDRIISAYFYLRSGSDEDKKELGIPYQDIICNYNTFKDFVMNIEKDGLIDKIIHLKPMYYFLCDEEKNIKVTKVFKIENTKEIDDFLLSIGVNDKLSETHENSSNHEHYTEYLDREVIEEINRLYKDDFEIFNYKQF